MHEYDFTPLTKQSRVLRRGRGRRVEVKSSSEEEVLSVSAREIHDRSNTPSMISSGHAAPSDEADSVLR